MCSITTPARLPQRAPKPVSQIRKTITLKTYLDASYKKVWTAGKLGRDLGLRTHVPFSIYLESVEGSDPIYAGNSFEINGTVHHLDELECFSGSLVKVAAMFAAFKLRQEAETLRLAIKDTVPLAKFFGKLAERVKPTGAVDEILNNDKVQKKPMLTDILAITSMESKVAFTDNFLDHMRRMIIPSDDCETAECIFRLSYPYINVKLMEDGFYDRTTKKGIWLAGDYFQVGCLKRTDRKFKTRGQAFVRIDTVNDCDQTGGPLGCGSAQNTTSKQMAGFFLKILRGQLVDPKSADEMRLILAEAQHGGDSSFLGKEPPPDTPTSISSNRASGSVLPKFTIEGVKIGQGAIKPDPERGQIEVRSEGAIIKWRNITKAGEDEEDEWGKQHFDKDLKKRFESCKLTGQAAICWQNFSAANPNTDGIIEIINDSISNFINQAPLTP
jgi:hypothetical protein